MAKKNVGLTEKIKIREFIKLKISQAGKGVRSIITSGWKPSGDLKNFPEGVLESRVVDREKDEYHQTIKDAKTGKIVEDEHEPLSKHKPKAKN